MSLDIIVVGAGNRGTEAFAPRFQQLKEKGCDINIVGVADPDENARTSFAQRYGLPENRSFANFVQAFDEIGDEANAVLNATPDEVHHEVALDALGRGYHQLLEKPMAASPKECIDIVNAQEKSGKVLSVCHVLRYSDFFNTIRDFVSSGELGKVSMVNLAEEIGHWHFVHSYVQNKMWNNSPPIMLTKSCHDLDILEYIIGSAARQVYSVGDLMEFRPENAPEGAADRCIDCKHHEEGTCLYDAVKTHCPELYEYEIPEDLIPRVLAPQFFQQKLIPYDPPTPDDPKTKAKLEALKTSDYGRCAYKMGNTVPDRQTVTIQYENGVIANFTLNAHNPEMNRRILVYGTKGLIQGQLDGGEIFITRHTGMRRNHPTERIELQAKGAHGGGDIQLIADFYDQVERFERGEKVDTRSNAEASLSSHLQAFAAEESRELDGEPILLSEFYLRYS